MDGERFDRFTRALSSRRTALGRLLIGGLLAALGVPTTSGDVAAAPCPKGKKRCRGRCIPVRQCCTSAQCRPKGSGKICRRGRCGCPASKKACGQQCIPKAACCGGCPAGQICQGAACCYATAAALHAALGPGGPATIRLCAGTTYQGSFELHRNVTVIGAGATSTILSGGGTTRVVRVFDTVTAAELRNLQITNGRDTIGAGLANGGNLLLNGCLVTDNVTPDRGGGIHNFGPLTLLNTGVTNNRANEGGGISNSVGDDLSLRGASYVAGNVAFSRGGGIFVQEAASQVSLHDTSIVTNNDADPDVALSGGGIYNEPISPGVLAFFGQARVTGNRPNQCTGPTSCPS